MRKTIDKTRRGGLPAPTDEKPSIETGNGNRCSGCNETIEPVDMLYFVHLRGVAPLRFHDVCYNAWATFQREPRDDHSRHVADRCPRCGSAVAPSQWRARGTWINAAGEEMPERRRQFRPAQCTNRGCEWEGPTDEAAVREAQERARDTP